MDADFDKDGWATAKAIIISKAMRKITQMIARQKVALVFTNQLRQKLGVMFGDPWTTSVVRLFHSIHQLVFDSRMLDKSKISQTIPLVLR